MESIPLFTLCSDCSDGVVSVDIGGEELYTNLLPPFAVSNVSLTAAGTYEVWVALDNALTSLRIWVGNVSGYSVVQRREMRHLKGHCATTHRSCQRDHHGQLLESR